jgi:hypothetical protein
MLTPLMLTPSQLPVPKLSNLPNGNETEHGSQKLSNLPNGTENGSQFGTFETSHGFGIKSITMAGSIPQYIQSSRYSLFEMDMVPRGTLVIHFRT